MRIRKRFPPPSLPLLSDPQLNSTPLLVQQLKRVINPCQESAKDEPLPSDLPNLTLSQPSDHPPAVVTKGKSTSWVLFGGNSNQDKMEEKDEELAEDENMREKVKSFGSNDNDNNRKENFLTPQLAGSLLLQLSSASSDLVDGRWCIGDKVIPLKKRRDSYRNTSSNTLEEAKMKSKTNKKCPQENKGSQEDQEGENGLTHEEGFESTSGHKAVDGKKNKRGSVILEGSRCSRVNGRGWRCCRQTLVGYSLCEHHLGKGRLRSMTSVRSASNKKKKQEEIEEKVSLPNDNNMEDRDKEKSIMVTKKKMKKLGLVKARSLSSLLGQTDNVVAAVKRTDNSFPQPIWNSKSSIGS